jgi:hypothetical protein
MAATFAGGMAELEATAEDKMRARAALVQLLAFHVDNVLKAASRAAALRDGVRGLAVGAAFERDRRNAGVPG